MCCFNEKLWEPLPWNWVEKVSDFVKPGDRVLDLRRETSAPEESVDVLLARGVPYDLERVWRLLKSGGFFLTEQSGSGDCRELAEFLVPSCRRGWNKNLENQLPLLRAAGFRAMYRNQAYPAKIFADKGELLAYIDRFPEKFPGFSVDACAKRLERLPFPLKTAGHSFIMIGKKQAADKP